MPRKQLALLIVCALVALSIGMLAARALFNRSAPMQLVSGTAIAPPREIPAFQLTDQAGAAFTNARLENHWTLLFFGFTNCPDVCPTTLAFLAQLDKSLADLPAAERPQVVFVSVDSARDTPEKLAAYVKYFSPSFTGVTGTPAAIESFTRSLGVPYAITPNDSGGYNVDHSAAMLLVDPSARLSAIFTPPRDLKAMSTDLRTLVSARG